MSTTAGRWDWKLRLLGAALGALASLITGLLMLVTIVGLYVGAAGIPAGAVIGALFAPRLARSQSPAFGAATASGLACLLGVAVFLLVTGLGGGHGGSIGDLVAYARGEGLMFSAVGLGFGVPMSLAAAAIATFWGRRAAKDVDTLWIPSAVAVALVIGGFGVVLYSAALAGAPEVARRADEVSIEYVVITESTAASSRDELVVELRTYWAGERVFQPNDGGVPPGVVGRDRVQGSAWALWLTSEATWEDRPRGDPVVTSAEYGRGPVQLTITVSAGGSVAWERGIRLAEGVNE